MSDQADQKEAFLFHTINDFEDLILEYGADYVMGKLRYPVYMKLFNYFNEL